MAGHAGGKVTQDDLLFSLAALNALLDRGLILIVVGATVAPPVAGAASGLGLQEGCAEAVVVLLAKAGAEGVHRLEELDQVVGRDGAVLDLLVEQFLEVGELVAVQVLAHADADLLESLVDALGDAGGRAEAADRHREAVGEIGRARLEAKLLDDRIRLRLVAHSDLELLCSRGKLDIEDVLEDLHLTRTLMLGANVDVVQRVELAGEPCITVILDLVLDLGVELFHDLGEDFDRAEGVLHACVDGEELGVDADGEAVSPLANLAAHLDSVERRVNEHLVGCRYAGAELAVKDVGDDAADLLLRLRITREGLSVLRVGDLAHELLDNLVEIAIGVDVNAGETERAGEAANDVLLCLRGQGGLVLAEALGGVGAGVAPEVAAVVVAATGVAVAVATAVGAAVLVVFHGEPQGVSGRAEGLVEALGALGNRRDRLGGPVDRAGRRGERLPRGRCCLTDTVTQVPLGSGLCRLASSHGVRRLPVQGIR